MLHHVCLEQNITLDQTLRFCYAIRFDKILDQKSMITMAFQVAVYALLKTAIQVEVLLSHERHCNNSSSVGECKNMMFA